MRVTRVYIPAPLVAGTQATLPDAAATHIARVLRLRIGAPLIAFDGGGSDFRCEITAIEGDSVRVTVGQKIAGLPESALRITLVQGVSRGERMDWTIQKAVELGVTAIAPVIMARSVVRLDAEQAQKKLRHWQGIAANACEQCGRSVVPEVRPPQDFAQFLATAPRDGQRFVLSPSGQTSLAGFASVSTRVKLLIGPEGGLDDSELERAQQAGFTPVHLGPRVLRTETAGVVALTMLQTLWGDLQ
jgi:16S rRNA (uracil1498-N3)-methyltransferase